MNARSHPIDENLENTGDWEGSHLKASVRHSGSSSVFEKNKALKPPRERPRGAAAPIVMGVWGTQTP